MRDASDFNDLVGELGDFQIFHKEYGEPLYDFKILDNSGCINYCVKNNVHYCRIRDLHQYAEIKS